MLATATLAAHSDPELRSMLRQVAAVGGQWEGCVQRFRDKKKRLKLLRKHGQAVLRSMMGAGVQFSASIARELSTRANQIRVQLDP
jgi:hypothetical protein